MASYKGASRYGTDEVKAKPRNDAYTGQLIISFIAMIAGAVLLYVDFSTYGATTPPKMEPPPLKIVKSEVAPPPAPPAKVDPPKADPAPKADPVPKADPAKDKDKEKDKDKDKEKDKDK